MLGYIITAIISACFGFLVCGWLSSAKVNVMYDILDYLNVSDEELEGIIDVLGEMND